VRQRSIQRLQHLRTNQNPSPSFHIVEVTPALLHGFWPFIHRGLIDIWRKVHPDWLPENIFSSLTLGQANCCVGMLGQVPVAYVVYYKQLRPFSHAPELFIWAAWNIPPRERGEDDNMSAVVAKMWEYLSNVAKGTYGTNKIAWITTRDKGFYRRFGVKPAFFIYQVEV
jgi:hypothetical protein